MKLSRLRAIYKGSHGLIALNCITACLLTACGGGKSEPEEISRSLAPVGDNRTIAYLDTGITANQCYQAGSDILISCTDSKATALNDWQDGMVGRDVTSPDAIDGALGFSFSTVGSYAKTECVKDNVTGLIWEGKPTTGTRASTSTYTNFGDNRAGDSSTYVTTVNTGSGLCGYTDWRLPNRFELQGLVNYAEVGFAKISIDTTWFPNSLGSAFWTSTGYIGNSRQAWSVNFGNGDISKHPASKGDGRGDLHHVRLVRGSAPVTTSFTFSSDGTEVTDTRTKLIWSRCSYGQTWNGNNCAGTPTKVTHEQALAAAKLNKGWRLPNIKEISSLVDGNRENPSLDGSVFPSTVGYSYWSSTPYVGSGSPQSNFVWTVDFNVGSVGALDRRATPSAVRLVRSAP